MKLSFKLPKLKLLPILLNQKYWYILLALIALVLISYLGFFIYQNFYRTITQAEEIVVLKQEVAPDTIDTAKVNAVLSAIQNKISPSQSIKWLEVPNPFIVYQP